MYDLKDVNEKFKHKMFAMVMFIHVRIKTLPAINMGIIRELHKVFFRVVFIGHDFHAISHDINSVR